MASLKDAHQPETLDALGVALGNLPPILQWTGQTTTVPNTIANLVCTNVPGPLAPLYCMGHRMIEHYPWMPLGWRMGLSVAVMSYDTGMYFSFCADEKIPDDPRVLPGFLAEEFGRLCGRIGVQADSWAEPTAVVPPELRKPVPSPIA